MKAKILFAVFILQFSVLSGQWSSNGSSIYYNSGNVGIGTSSPGYPFHVEKSAASSSGDNRAIYVNAVQTAASTGNVVGIIGYSRAAHTSGNLTLGIGFAGNCELSSSGSVSILRSVQGGGILSGSGSVTDWSCFYGGYAATGSGTITNGYGLYITNFPSNTVNKWGVYISDATAKNYFAGNVGIGTSSTGSFKLAVEGKIGAREVEVTITSPWPDYVFHNTYDLMSIDDLKSYIKINGHLPNIQSAAQIEKTGRVAVGEMQIKLLEKVEELTLYIIQLKNEVEGLKSSKN